MSDIIQLRRDLESNWISFNPVLAIGEVGYSSDVRKIKFGDGVSDWVTLPYYFTDAENYISAVYNAGTEQNITVANIATKSLIVEYSCIASSSQQEGVLRVTHNGVDVNCNHSFACLPDSVDMDIEVTVFIDGSNLKLKLINNSGEEIIFCYKKEEKK